VGAKIGTIFARAGHEVVFSYSHSERKLKRLLQATIKYDRSIRDAVGCAMPRLLESRRSVAPHLGAVVSQTTADTHD
jgi:hypothetical protein